MPTKSPPSRAPKPAPSARSGDDPTGRRLSGGINDSLGFLIADSSRYVKRSLYARIAKHGIRGGAWFVLRVLWQEDGVTHRELAHRLGLMEPSVLEMVRAMESDGLIERRRDEQDRRKVRVYLTPRAFDLKPVLMDIAENVNDMMLTGFSEAEEALLKLLLRRVRETLCADIEASALTLADDGLSMDKRTGRRN